MTWAMSPFRVAPSVHCIALWNCRRALAGGFWWGVLDQAEPPGDVACGGRLQQQGRADRERDEGGGDLGALDALGAEYARHGGRDDPRVTAPAQEGELVPRPLAAPVREQAGEDGDRTGDEDEDHHHQEPAQEVLAKRVERQVDAKGDED